MNLPRDPLELSVRALREMTTAHVDGGETRQRIFNRVAGRRRHRRYRIGLLLALFLSAAPVVSAGWKYLRRMPLLHGTATHAKRLNRLPLVRENGPLDQQPPSLAFEPVPQDSPSSIPLPMLDGRDTKTRARPPGPPQLSELGLYGRAHDAHFHQKDFKKALRLWAQYLSRFPQGRFLPEAEFNRAVCLVNLGDLVSAQQALAKLASSPSSEYPKAQAKRLLDELH